MTIKAFSWKAYGRLEALSSLIDHMCSYANVLPSDRRPRIHLHADDLAVLQALPLPPRAGPRIAICADFLDPLRHAEGRNQSKRRHA